MCPNRYAQTEPQTPFGSGHDMNLIDRICCVIQLKDKIKTKTSTTRKVSYPYQSFENKQTKSSKFFGP